METLLFIATILALTGAYLNSIGKKEAFYFWIFTNAVFAANNYMIQEYSQMVLFLAYLLISINGVRVAKC